MIFYFNPVNPINRNFSYFGSAKQLPKINVMDPFNYKSYWEMSKKNTRQFNEIFNHQDGYKELVESTERLAYLIRSYSVYSMTCAGLGHPGGTFSEAELLAVMYNHVFIF